MSLPPDPHDDDLADRSPAPSPLSAGSPATAAADGVAGWPSAPPAAAPPPPPPPPEPAPTDPTVDLMSTAPLSGIPRHEPPRPPSQPPPQPEPDAAAGGGGGNRLALMLSAVVAVIAIAGIVVVLTDDESTETTSEQTSAGTSAGGGTSGDSGTDDDPDSPASSPDAAASTPSESPVEVAEAFFTAVESGDCEEIIARMTVESFSSDGETPEEAVAECEADEEGLAAIMSADFWSVELVSEDGDQAAVAVTLVTDDGEAVRELPLRLVDGEWKMDLDPSLTPSPS